MNKIKVSMLYEADTFTKGDYGVPQITLYAKSVKFKDKNCIIWLSISDILRIHWVSDCDNFPEILPEKYQKIYELCKIN